MKKLSMVPPALLPVIMVFSAASGADSEVHTVERWHCFEVDKTRFEKEWPELFQLVKGELLDDEGEVPVFHGVVKLGSVEAPALVRVAGLVRGWFWGGNGVDDARFQISLEPDGTALYTHKRLDEDELDGAFELVYHCEPQIETNSREN